jgi:hypothetical protein
MVLIAAKENNNVTNKHAICATQQNAIYLPRTSSAMLFIYVNYSRVVSGLCDETFVCIFDFSHAC